MLQYLAAAGIGKLGIIDDDDVSLSNLHRQILFGTEDVGRPKAEVAAEVLGRLNPHVEIEPIVRRLDRENALEIMERFDVIADGTDNFATRYLVNDACVLLGKPNIYASIYRFDGQVSVFGAPDGPCYRCLFPEPPPPGTVPSCAEGGVLGVLPGMVGTLQATEVVKWVTGIGDPLVGRLLMVDALTMDMRTLKAFRDPECQVCGDSPRITELQDYETFCGMPPQSEASIPATSDTEPVSPMFFGPRVPEVTATRLSELKASGDEFLLLDVRHPEELAIADLGGTLVPMEELPTKLGEVAPEKEGHVVVMCRSGSRSAHVVAWMQQLGYTNVYNLAGGIIAWSREVDPSVAIY